MVIRIKTGKYVRGALNYNEQKVIAGKAELIMCSKFGCDLSELGFSEKLTRFERLNEKRKKVCTNTLHLSINFSPDDNIDTVKMQAIAFDYMKRIGFGDQPYLVYRHDDAHHPHIHIVSTIIKPDGRPINVHKLGQRKSEPARKAIEKEYELIPAESMKKVVALPLQPVKTESALYGQGETKRAISNIVQQVVSSYHFSTLEEMNLILKQYNVTADPGSPGSRMRMNRGLIYSMLDQQGNKTGIPIKASSIFSSPTLSVLEKKFNTEILRKHLYSARAIRIFKSFLAKPGLITEIGIKQMLSKNKIHCEFIRNEAGMFQNIYLVDHISKVALNHQDIQIPLEMLQNRLSTQLSSLQKTKYEATNEKKIEAILHLPELTIKLLKGMMLDNNHDAETTGEFFKKKKKKRKHRY